MNIIFKRIQNLNKNVGLIPECQSEIRNGRGNRDNIFSLTALIQLALDKYEHGIFAIFIDLKVLPTQ